MFARSHIAIRGEVRGLLGFCFHSVAPQRQLKELDRLVSPDLSISTEALSDFIESFQAYGYRFVTPQQIADGLAPDRPHVFLSFDDGYRNNEEIVPVLRRHGVPATIFVSTNHVAEQRAFWWDVLYRERLRRGVRGGAVHEEMESIKSRPHADIEAYVREAFGLRTLSPVGDLDRPFRIEELQRIAREPLIHLGNHTADHAILTNCTPAEMQRQLGGAQAQLEAWTGRRPIAVAYPNGNHSAQVAAAAGQEGLQLGFTVVAKRNRLPLTRTGLLAIHRYLARRRRLHARDYLQFRSIISIRQAAEIVGIVMLRRWMRL